jgi:hypothetical protein
MQGCLYDTLTKIEEEVGIDEKQEEKIGTISNTAIYSCRI